MAARLQYCAGIRPGHRGRRLTYNHSAPLAQCCETSPTSSARRGIGVGRAGFPDGSCAMKLKLVITANERLLAWLQALRIVVLSAAIAVWLFMGGCLFALIFLEISEHFD
jgi:hypothetical protein